MGAGAMLVLSPAVFFLLISCSLNHGAPTKQTLTILQLQNREYLTYIFCNGLVFNIEYGYIYSEEKMTTVARLFMSSILLLALSACFAGDATDVQKSESDVQQIVQKVIDYQGLDAYFHVDVRPERSPLIIMDNDLLRGIHLEKFGQQVQFMSRPDILKKRKPYLAFSKINIQADEALLMFVYPAEGIAGEVHLEKQKNTWKVTAAKIVER